LDWTFLDELAKLRPFWFVQRPRSGRGSHV